MTDRLRPQPWHAEAITLRQRGLSLAQIAKRLRIHRSTTKRLFCRPETLAHTHEHDRLRQAIVRQASREMRLAAWGPRSSSESGTGGVHT